MKTYFNHLKNKNDMETKNKRNQKQADEYKAEILKKSGIGIGTAPDKYALLRPEYHHRMEELVRLFAEEGMTVEDYLDNVLAEHFTQFGNEIEASLARNTKRNPRHEHDKPTTKAAKGKRNTTDSERALATFLESSEIKTRQCVYIDRETHRQIAHITRFLGEGLSIGKFVDNVLRDHLRKHKALYKQSLRNINPAEL